jgi:hypothetical protein
VPGFASCSTAARAPPILATGWKLRQQREQRRGMLGVSAESRARAWRANESLASIDSPGWPFRQRVGRPLQSACEGCHCPSERMPSLLGVPRRIVVHARQGIN